MYNVDDILARLEKGEDAETIAQEYTDALNNAIKELDAKKKAAEKAKKEAEAAKKKAAAEQQAKQTDAQHIADAITGYMCRWYGSTEEIKADDIINIFDNVFDMVKAVKKLDKISFPLKSKTSDEVISDFLKELGF